MNEHIPGETLNDVFVQENGIIRNSEGTMIGLSMDRYNKMAARADKAQTERDNWEESAARLGRDLEFYRDLLDKVAVHLGPEVYVADDGSVMEDPVRLKIPELVGKLREETVQENPQPADVEDWIENRRSEEDESVRLVSGADFIADAIKFLRALPLGDDHVRGRFIWRRVLMGIRDLEKVEQGKDECSVEEEPVTSKQQKALEWLEEYLTDYKGDRWDGEDTQDLDEMRDEALYDGLMILKMSDVPATPPNAPLTMDDLEWEGSDHDWTATWGMWEIDNSVGLMQCTFLCREIPVLVVPPVTRANSQVIVEKLNEILGRTKGK